MKHFSSSSTVKALHGTANSLFPIRRNPPKETTAYATRPVGISIMISSTVPRSSPAELRTVSPSRVLAARTLRNFLDESVCLILSTCMVPPNVANARCYPSDPTFAGHWRLASQPDRRGIPGTGAHNACCCTLIPRTASHFRQCERDEYFLPPGVLELGNSYNG